jgi:hypothetical protein
LSGCAKLVDLILKLSRKLMLPRGLVRARLRDSNSERLSSFTMPFGSTCTGSIDVKPLVPATFLLVKHNLQKSSSHDSRFQFRCMLRALLSSGFAGGGQE